MRVASAFMAQQIRRRTSTGMSWSSAAASTSRACASCVAAPADAEPPTASEAGRAHPVLLRGARRADRLRGRDAEPGLLRPRLARRGPGARRRWQLVVGELRRRGQHVSPADLIGGREHGARARPDPRARARVARRTCSTGSSALWSRTSWSSACRIRCSTPPTPCCAAGRAGSSPTGMSRPPFVRDLEAGAGTVRAGAGARGPDGRPAAGGGARTLAAAAPDRRAGPARLRADRTCATPASAGACASTVAFDGEAVEASGYGPTVGAAAAARLLERLARVERDAAAAATVLADAALCGVVEVAGPLLARVRELVGAATDLEVRSSPRCARSLHLYRYEARARHRGRPGVPGAARGRLRPRAVVARRPRRRRTRASRRSRAVVETFERCGAALDRRARAHRRAGAAAGRRRTPRPGCAVPRSAPCGCSTPRATTSSSPGRCSSPIPELLGDFLFGLFTLAREPVQRRPDLVERIDEVVMAFADERVPRGAPRPAARVQRVHAAREGPARARAAGRCAAGSGRGGGPR